MDRQSKQNLLYTALAVTTALSLAYIYTHYFGVPWIVTAPIGLGEWLLSVGYDIFGALVSNFVIVVGALFLLGFLFSEE